MKERGDGGRGSAKDQTHDAKTETKKRAGFPLILARRCTSMTTKRGVATSTRRREEGRRTRGKGLALMKMYRGRKSRAE